MAAPAGAAAAASTGQSHYHEVEVLVVGGGVAASTFIETFTQLRPQVTVGLVSPSPLLKQVSIVASSGRTLDQLQIDEVPVKVSSSVIHFEESASGLDGVAHTLFTESGGVIKYQYLCICTGARPLVLANVPSTCTSFIVTLRDTQSVESLAQQLKHCRKILLVGNGGIATELVYELKNCHIIWAVKDDAISATFFDAATANFFLPKLTVNKTTAEESRKCLTSRRFVAHSGSNAALGPHWNLMKCLQGSLSDKNVTVLYGCQVECIKEAVNTCTHGATGDSSLTNFPLTVTLTNGESIQCDLIISATGVTPNVQPFLHNNNFSLSSDGALKVNRDMETSVKDVFAAGDVCHPEWQDECELWLHMRLWSQARQMAFYAAHCIESKFVEKEKRETVKLSNSIISPVNKETQRLPDNNETDDKVESSHRLYFNFDIFSHVTTFFGYKVILLGLYNGQGLKDYKMLFRADEDKQCIKVIVKHGKMKGAILIGDTDLEETFENLILSQIDISRIEEQLLDGVVDIEDYFD